MAYSMEELLLLMEPCAPLDVRVLQQNRRKVEHGLTTMGLKIHCFSKDGSEFSPLVEALGGRQETFGNRWYKHANAAETLVLPPVGNVRSAIQLLECIGKFLGQRFFHNPKFQLQVCSPSRLDPYYANILSVMFFLGTDMLRRYTLESLTTTFSVDTLYKTAPKHRGRRIVLYDGDGSLDRDFEWWDLQGSALVKLPCLPFSTERTDMLPCQSKVDVENVNLLMTLLSHHQHLGWWEDLGRRFVWEVEELLERHLLIEVLHVPWIHPGDGSKVDDTDFFLALENLTEYAFEEYVRLRRQQESWWKRANPARPGILAETRQLLAKYRAELVAKSDALSKEEDT